MLKLFIANLDREGDTRKKWRSKVSITFFFHSNDGLEEDESQRLEDFFAIRLHGAG